MKRIIIAAAALILAASCSKQDQDIVSENDIIVATGKPFTAVIEQETTRSVLTSDYKVNWESGDRISINGAEYSATPDESDATKADFTYVSGADPEPTYKAVFPASLYNAGTLELPAVQTYAAGKFNAPMYAESETENLSFKNICGVICLALKGTESVKTITITANEPVCGTFTMTDATTVSLSGTGKTVTLQYVETGKEFNAILSVPLNEETATKFYIYLPPGTYSAGMKLTITSDKGGVYEKTTAKDVTIERSNIYTFNWTANFAPALPSGALPGKFSVADGVQVHFSKSNLYAYKKSLMGGYALWTWGFHNNQYESNSIAATDGARTATSADGEIDLFTWGYDDTNSINPTGAESDNVSVTDGTLSQTQDWGSKVMTGLGETTSWRTPAEAEWQYLFEGRAGASNLYRCGVTVCGMANCVVLAPDGYTGTIESSYDEAGWAAAELAGLVCLPAAGQRQGASVIGVGSNGCYWSSTATDAGNAGYMSFTGSGVSVSDDGLRASGCSVRLIAEDGVAVESIRLDKTSVALECGETVQLEATVLPANATNKKLNWSSSNTAVATVDANGKVTAVSTGTAVITATAVSGNKTATCMVNINFYSVESISLNKRYIFMKPGEEYQLTVTILPENATNKNVTWKSSNTAAATVDQTGKVTLVSGGTSVITVTSEDGLKFANCTVNDPLLVDMGLSVLWATCNVGASNPWEYGGYYQWGGTKDVTDTNINLNWANCPYHTGSSYTTGWTKYVSSSYSSYWSGTGDPDGKSVLDPGDDAATVNLGSDWRMPTGAEWQELLDNCTWEWTDKYNGKGVAGYVVTSNKDGYADRSIFLPAAGFRGNTDLHHAGRYGYYWSSSLCTGYAYDACYLYLYSGGRTTNFDYRYHGQSVRPVYP